jgi:putative oxidoreductase
MFRLFRKNKDIGIFLFRFFIGFRLLYGVMDNIISRERMIEFEGFLKSQHFPYPYVAAPISVYAQALAGLMILIGYKIRWASMLMIINFLVALVMVHWGQSLEEMTPALALFFAAVLFLFAGSGRYSVDKEPFVITKRA